MATVQCLNGRGSSSLFFVTMQPWHAAIGCRPDAADSEHELLAPAKDILLRQLRLSWTDLAATAGSASDGLPNNTAQY